MTIKFGGDFEEFKPALWRQLEKTFRKRKEGDFDVKSIRTFRKGENMEKVNS